MGLSLAGFTACLCSPVYHNLSSGGNMTRVEALVGGGRVYMIGEGVHWVGRGLMGSFFRGGGAGGMIC